MNDRDILNLFTDLVRAHTAHIDRTLSELGLSNGQGGVISSLGRCGPMTQNELARFRQVSPATISVMINRMERDGMVQRNSRDGTRANRIDLTDRGRELYKAIDALMARQPSVVFAGLSDEELEQARVLFEKLHKNIAE